VIDQDQLCQAWASLDIQIPEPFYLGGVSFRCIEGHREWVAFLASMDEERPMGCEGDGDTPTEALDDLRRHMRQEHPVEFGGIS
jgi:hypothetical protein